jgi:hypothetical protein
MDEQPFLIESSPKIERNGTALDNIGKQLFKRLYSIAPLFAMSFSTMNQIVEVTKSFTSQAENRSYGSTVTVESDGVWSGYTCEYGKAQAVVTYCEYTPFPAFQAVIVIWVVYFAVFMTARLYATSRYSTDDLRFYIAMDKYNGQLLNRVLVALGFFLTVLTLCVGIYYLSPQTEWNNTVDTQSTLDLIVFLGINICALSGFSKQFITSHSGAHGDLADSSMAEFDHPVYIKHGRLLASVDGAIQPVLTNYMLCLSRNDGYEGLRQFGEPEQLIDAMNKLYK